MNETLEKFALGSYGRDEIYKLTINRIFAQGTRDVRLAKKALLWILRAQRPLSITELQYALAFESQRPLSAQDRLVPLEEILAVCAGLLQFDQNTFTVRLYHQTTHTYLQEHSSDLFPEGDATLAMECVSYLSSLDCGSIMLERLEQIIGDGYSYDLTWYIWTTGFSKMTLLKYALNQWGYHVSHADNKGFLTPSIKQYATDLLQNHQYLEFHSRISSLLEQRFSRSFDCHFFEVHRTTLAAYFDMEFALQDIIQLAPILETDHRESFPIVVAAANASRKTLKLILESKACGERSIYISLCYAAHHGHIDIARLLLDNNACPELFLESDRNRRTPLMIAADGGHAAIGRLLLETRKVNVNYRTREGTAFLLAAKSGNIEFLKLLIGTNPSLTSLKAESTSPRGLEKDLRDNNTGTTKSVYESRLNPNLTDFTGSTAIAQAVLSGKVDTVTLLFNIPRMHTNRADFKGRTPLHHAVTTRNFKIVNFLLATGDFHRELRAEADMILGTSTPLSAAVRGIHGRTFEPHLDASEPNMNLSNVRGTTPVQTRARVESQRPSISVTLVDTDEIDMEGIDDEGSGPLQFAIERLWRALRCMFNLHWVQDGSKTVDAMKRIYTYNLPRDEHTALYRLDDMYGSRAILNRLLAWLQASDFEVESHPQIEPLLSLCHELDSKIRVREYYSLVADSSNDYGRRRVPNEEDLEMLSEQPEGTVVWTMSLQPAPEERTMILLR